MRVNGWERLLTAAVEKHMALPSQYGISDCFVFPMDCVEAITGVRHWPDCRQYRTEQGAGKSLRRKGFANVEEAFSSKFEEIPVLIAQRGDIGVIEIDGVVSGGVFTPLGFAVRDTERVQFRPVTEAKTAFRVK